MYDVPAQLSWAILKVLDFPKIQYSDVIMPINKGFTALSMLVTYFSMLYKFVHFYLKINILGDTHTVLFFQD